MFARTERCQVLESWYIVDIQLINGLRPVGAVPLLHIDYRELAYMLELDVFGEIEEITPLADTELITIDSPIFIEFQALYPLTIAINPFLGL